MRRLPVILIWGLLLPVLVQGGAAATGPYESDDVPPPTNSIDTLVFGRLRKLNIERAPLCSDAVFVRRVYLDVTGTVPPAWEAQRFMQDPSPRKRAALIDRLLESGAYADYWAMKWSDLLRVKAEFPINLWPNAAQAYHHWIRDSLRRDVPYDQFARDLLTTSGSNFEVPPVNFYRALQKRDVRTIAQAVALTFMGVRAEKWPSNQLSDMAVFFANLRYKPTHEWKEEIVSFDASSTNPGAILRPTTARFPDGSTALLAPGDDPRRVFADWLTAPRNAWFKANAVNRVWFWLLGRGIVMEPDDFRADNPPSNPELLRYLETQLASSHYDLKQIYRLILNAQTYQLSSLAHSSDPVAAANFASYAVRRLDAEVLIDALNQVTGSTEKYSSAIPEPYTFIPEGQSAVSLPDGSISSSFLELFGKPPRDSGQALERNNRISAGQELTLLNASDVQRKIQKSRMIGYQLEAGKTTPALVTGLYWQILSRYPTAAELNTATAYFQSSGESKRDAATDVAWALLNNAEFLYRH
jgi:hypothetical protein